MDELGLASYPEDLRRDRAAHPRADPARAAASRRCAGSRRRSPRRSSGGSATRRRDDDLARRRPRRACSSTSARTPATARSRAPTRCARSPTRASPRRSRWDEVADVDPAAFTVETMRARIAAVGDPMRGMWRRRRLASAALRAARPRPARVADERRPALHRAQSSPGYRGGDARAWAALAALAAAVAVIAPWPRRRPPRRRTSATASTTTPGSATAPARSINGSTGSTALGVELVRVNVAWSEVEPRRGVFDWSGYDAVVDGLHERGIEPVLTLVGDPGLGERRPRPTNWAPDERRELRRLRGSGGGALPVREALADLERAEPAPLAPADRRRRRTSTAS